MARQPVVCQEAQTGAQKGPKSGSYVNSQCLEGPKSGSHVNSQCLEACRRVQSQDQQPAKKRKSYRTLSLCSDRGPRDARAGDQMGAQTYRSRLGPDSEVARVVSSSVAAKRLQTLTLCSDQALWGFAETLKHSPCAVIRPSGALKH